MTIIKDANCQKLSFLYKPCDKDWDVTNLVVFVVTFLIILFSIYKLGWHSVYVGHDFWYHAQRIESLHEQLMNGELFSPVSYYFFHGYGYASSIGYPDLLLVIPALFRFYFSLTESYNIFLFLCILFSVISAYMAGYTVFEKKWVALVFTVIYCLVMYKFVNLHIRSALGEVQGAIFLPLAFAGIYDLIFKDFKRSWLLIIGFVGLCYTHVITTYIVAVFSILICITHVKSVVQNWKKLCLCGLVIFGITAPFVLPCAELYLFQDIKAHYPHQNTLNNALSISQLMSFDNWLGGFQLIIETGLLFVLCFFPREKSLNKKVFRCSLFFALFSLFAITKFFPWGSHPLLNSIQFPWRLFGCASFFLAASLACVLLQIDRKLGLLRITAAIIIFLFFLSSLLVWNQIERSPSRVEYNILNSDPLFGTWLEFTPHRLSTDYIVAEGNKCRANTGSFLDCSMDLEKRQLLLTMGKKVTYVDVPLTYYIGYKAVNVHDNENVPISESPNGVCRILTKEVPVGSTVKIYYKGTFVQKISSYIFYATCLCLFVYLLLTVRKRKIKRANTI